MVDTDFFSTNKKSIIRCMVGTFMAVMLVLGVSAMTSGPAASCDDGTIPVCGDEILMEKKAHGTCPKAVMDNLMYGADKDTADRISCYNRHYAEYSGYAFTTDWVNQIKKAGGQVTYYDSVTGKPLFTAPGASRTLDQFIAESRAHGWPSFRDEEVNWENVRMLKDGETVSVDGTHLGHNLPDKKGNRYCINLVCIAGNKAEPEKSN